MQYFVFLCVISYIVTPGNLRFYYIQSGETIGYKSNVNSPTLWSGIRLSRSGSSVLHTTMERIPAGDPKQRRRRRGRRSGLLVRLLRRAHRAPLLSILLANIQSLDNKVDEIRARVAFQRDIRDCNVLCFTKHGSLETRYRSRNSQLVSSHIAATEISIFLVRRRAGVYALWLTRCGVIITTYRNLSPFVHLT